MAALMIHGGKLTDRWCRKRCFTIFLVIYNIGAMISAASPGLGVLILGNSILEGVGTALLIPPVYILTTMLFTDIPSRVLAASSARSCCTRRPERLISGSTSRATTTRGTRRWRTDYAGQPGL